MTKTERYMWLANDLLLTAAAVSLIINLFGQTASGYAFSGSMGRQQNCFMVPLFCLSPQLLWGSG